MDKKLIESRYKRIADELRDTPGILEKLYFKKDFARVGHNVDVMARSLLLRAMMKWRVEDDTDSARADLRCASQLSLELDRALAGIRENTSSQDSLIDVSNIEVPLFACILAPDWDRAKALAEMCDSPFVADREDLVHATMTRLLGALVLDKSEQFSVLRKRFDGQKKNRWWQYFTGYVDLYELVMKRDWKQFAAGMRETEDRFHKRKLDRKFGDLRPEYGGGENNDVVFDFMATAIANIAASRGYNLNGPSESYFPVSASRHS